MNDFNILISKEAEQYFINKVGQDKSVKLSLKSSGCSGYAYKIEMVSKDLATNTFRGIPFFILESDQENINNLVIDLKKDGLNTKIVFENPQAVNHCGCGASFALRK